MGFNRKCDVCDFKGLDINFFTINKKICDSCINEKLEYREKRKLELSSKRKEYYKKWYIENKKKQKEYLKEWRKENGDKLREYGKRNYEKNKDYINEYSRVYSINRRKSDPLFKLTGNLRNLIKNSLIKQKYSKKSKTYEIIGISYEEFKEFIESKFTDGMTWDNYGEWHLDHIIPISSALSEKQAILLCHYINFQPLWKIDNIRKSNTL